MTEEDQSVSQSEFIQNMDKKIIEPEFNGDIMGLLRTGITYDNLLAYEFVRKELLEKI
jgi:hypothetical protein